MSKFMTPKTSNDEFIRYEIDQEEFLVPAEVENDLPVDAKVLDRYFNQWFARMSADGFLDATGWYGPNKTEDQALYDLYVFHGESGETFFDFIEEGKLIIEGSLSIFGVHGELYGKAAEDGGDCWLATVGLTLDAVEYDPNNEPELDEAYGFELLSPAKVKVYQARYSAAQI